MGIQSTPPIFLYECSIVIQSNLALAHSKKALPCLSYIIGVANCINYVFGASACIMVGLTDVYAYVYLCSNNTERLQNN